MALLSLMKRMGRNDCTAHWIRTSFRVWAAEQTDTPREIAAMCLAHDVEEPWSKLTRGPTILRSDLI